MGWVCVLALVAAWLWPVGQAVRMRGRAVAPVLATHVVGAAEVADLAARLATALDAGLSLPAAWEHATGSGATGSGATGSDVVVLEAADPAGRDALLAMRAAIRLTDTLGVPAAGILRAVSVSVRDTLDAEAARRAATSGPVAAAWIVGGLPLVGPLVGSALGIDPVGILTGTPWGRVSGVAGLTLLGVGALWAHRLVVRAREASR